MRPRFVGRLGLADAVTVANAVLGFVAVVVAFTDATLAARLILLAAIADGLDGVVARWRGGTPAGQILDSLADVISFSAAPAVLVTVVVRRTWPIDTGWFAVGLVGAACFVAMAIVRLGLYTAYDVDAGQTWGIQTTLAAVILSAVVLADFTSPLILVVLTYVLAGLMVSNVPYPDLLARDALIMGVIHSLAVLVPRFEGRMFPYALLTLALAYLLFAPRFYWRECEPVSEVKGNALRES